MENNNYLSSGVNYIPLTVLDKDHSIFINENGGSFDLATKDGTTVGSVGRHCFGLGAPTQFFWEDNGVYDQAGIHYTEGDSGVFVNNTGDRGIAVWLYFGDNYNPNEAVDSMGKGSEGYTDPSEGLIGYWQKYTYILPNQNATIPWIMDDEVGAQSTRMYFQYVNGYVPGTSLEDWDGTGGSHNLSWSYNYAPTGNVGYGAEDLLPITYENLQEIQTNSTNEGLDSIHIMCMSVTGALLLDASPSNYVMTKDVLILDTDTDVYVDMDGPDYGPFSQMNWGPVSSQYYEIDDLTYATQNGNKIAIGDELTRVVSGDAQYGSHFLLNGLEIRPSSVTYNGTDQTTFVITIDYPAGSDGGDFEVEKFEHYFSRVQAEVITGFVEGSLMEGAKVTAKSKDGETLITYSDDRGKYTFTEPVTGDIIATGGTNTITNETVHDPSNEELVDDSSDLTTTRAPFKTNAALGGIVNAQSTLIVDLMKNHNMNKDTAVDAFIDAGKTLYDLDSNITRQQLNTYLKVGMVGLQNSDSDDTTLYAEMLKTNKAISELEEGFTNGGTSDNATLKEKRKAAIQLRKATTDIISSASKNKLTENANSYLSIAGSDSNLGTIGTNASDTSKNDMLYLINAKAIEEIDSKLTSTAKNLSSKADWKQAAATIVAAVSEKPFKSKSELGAGISYEEIFMHYNESAMRRKAGSNKVYDKKRLGLTPSKTDFINEADNATIFRISIVDGNYQTTGSIADAKGNTKTVSKTGSQRYSDDNMASIKPQISKGGKTYEIVRQGGKLVEVEKTDNALVVWGRGFARATYVTGETLSNALHSFESSELLINSDEFMLNNKGDRYNGEDESTWFSDEKFESFYPELIGQDDDSIHASLFKPGYKFVHGSHINVKDENGNIRNWNLVDFKTGRSIAEPGSQEEFNLLEIIENYINLLNNTTSIQEIASLIGSVINTQSERLRDSDGDNVPDGTDAFPNDATEWADSDSDGVGDSADAFPNDPTKFEHTPFAYTIDTTLAGDSLTQRFGTGLYHMTSTQQVMDLDNENVKLKIDWGEGAGWEYYGKSDSVEGRSLYNTQRYNFEHTYDAHGTYQIRVSYEDVITAYPNALTQPVPQGIGGWVYGVSDTDWAKRVTSVDSWGEMSTNRLFTAHGLYQYLENCQSWPAVDTSLITEVPADTFGTPFIAVAMGSILRTAKYVTSFNASDWNLTQGKGNKVNEFSRYFNRFRDTDRLETLNLNGLEYDKYASAWPDDNGYFGSLVPNGTLVGFNDITIDQDGGTFNSLPNNHGGFQGYLKGRIHKDSTFNNMSINNATDDIWRANPTSNSDIITDDSTYTFQQKNWIDTSGENKKLKVKNLPSFNLKGTNGETRTSGIDITVDLTSPNGWELHGSMLRQWQYGPQNSTLAAGANLTILGTGNWDTSNVTQWYQFMYAVPNTIILDMDISSWSFEGSPTAPPNSFSLPTLKSEQYTKALIAWAASEPSYSATINLGNAQYDYSAHTAKMSLINDYGWTITDAGNLPIPTKMTFRVGDSAYGNGSLTLKTYFNSLDNVDIDWGDGQTETFTGGKPQHTYASTGDYQVSFKFKGTEHWQSNNRSLTSAGDSRKLISIEQWGDFVWNSNMMWGEVVADVTATDVPTLTENFTGFTKSTFTFSAAATTAWENIDLSPVRSIGNLFQSCYTGLAQFGIDKWDTSQITTMSNTFSQRSPGDLIRNWNTSNVTNMYGMFASSSIGGDTLKTKVVNLGEANEYIAWDVSKVTSFGSFSSYGNAGSGTLDISNWQINTSAPVNMQNMFFRGGMPMEDLAKKTVTLANGTSYEAWNTSQVTNMKSMFYRASTAALNIDNASWDTRNVTDMQDFHFSYSGYPIPQQWDRDISGWDLSALINKNLGLFNYNNMNTAKFSTENYDAILIAWDAAGYTDISVNFGQSQFTSHGAAEAAHTSLASKGWTLTDGGAAPLPFKMKITTASADQTFTYGVSTNSGNAKTVWGDGETTAASAGGSHTYETPGEYIIEIHPTGSTSFKGFSAWSTPLVPLITEIMQWGDIEWEDNNWFLAEGAVYTLTATDVPNLSGVTSLANMFSAGTYGDNTLFSGGDAIGNWDVSTITNMHQMFKEVTSSSFTQDLSAWDVSNVTDMSGMFRHYPGYAQSYISPVINWGNKTRNVENFSAFFVGKKLASFIDNSGVGEFNTSSATNVASMFQQNDSFVNLNTRKINAGTADEYIAWDVKKVSNFSAFAWSGTGRFSQSNFPSNWYISGDGQDVNMYSMFGNFSGGVALDNLTDVDSFATKTITAESSAYGTEYSAWNMSNVTSLSAFARKLSSSLNFNIGSWNITNKMTNMSYMFSNYLNNATVFPRLDQDVSGWDISNVTSMDNIWFNRHGAVLKGVTFSTENYDALLISWSAQNTQFTSLNMGDSQYTQGGAAEAARQTLASAGVVITDGGPVLKEFFYDGGDGESSSSGACSLEATDTRGYFYGSGSYPAEGDELYTASVRDESNILTEGYYKIATADNTFSYAFVGADGSIEEFGECSTSVQYNYGNADRGQEGACNARSLDNTFYVAEEIGEEMPSTLYSDAALTTAINFSRSADGYYPFQLNGSNTRQTFNLSRGRFGAIGSCR